MSGRGDKNKNGTSGSGAGNQSNQPFIADGENQHKSNHNRQNTGGTPSEPQKKSKDQSSDRNQSV